jgi:nucleotide-binding universal stress UspA family protein
MANKEFLDKILVPVDGSTSSLIAEETAAKIAKNTGGNHNCFTCYERN